MTLPVDNKLILELPEDKERTRQFLNWFIEREEIFETMVFTLVYDNTRGCLGNLFKIGSNGQCYDIKTKLSLHLNNIL